MHISPKFEPWSVIYFNGGKIVLATDYLFRQIDSLPSFISSLLSTEHDNAIMIEATILDNSSTIHVEIDANNFPEESSEIKRICNLSDSLYQRICGHARNLL